jgi:hypothetical protein
VNAFSANDPESTLLAYDRVFGREGEEGTGLSEKPVGLLALRGDRGDRSLLWAEALAGGALDRFGRLYVHGLHAAAVRRKLRRTGGPEVEVLPVSNPEEIMRRVIEGGSGGQEIGVGLEGALFGFGNLGGLGEGMVRHWMEDGEVLPSGRVGDRVARIHDPSADRVSDQGGPHGL